MQQRPDVDDVGVGVARLRDRLVEPVAELLSLLRGIDVLVVFQVIADDEVGSPLFVTPTTDFLAGADCLDLDTVGEQDDRGLPDLSLQLSEVFLEDGVLFELRLDVREEPFRLFGTVRQDEDVMLVGIDRGVDGVLKGEGRALCVTTGCLDCPVTSIGPGDLFCRLPGVEALHDALAPYLVELPVERRGRPDEVVREIGPPEVFKIKRPELPAQPLRPGQLFPVLEVLEELRPTFGEVVTSDNIIEKKLPLVVTVCDHFTVFRLLEPFEVFIEVNLRHRSAPSLSPAQVRHAALPRAPGAA